MTSHSDDLEELLEQAEEKQEERLADVVPHEIKMARSRGQSLLTYQRDDLTSAA